MVPFRAPYAWDPVTRARGSGSRAYRAHIHHSTCSQLKVVKMSEYRVSASGGHAVLTRLRIRGEGVKGWGVVGAF